MALGVVVAAYSRLVVKGRGLRRAVSLVAVALVARRVPWTPLSSEFLHMVNSSSKNNKEVYCYV